MGLFGRSSQKEKKIVIKVSPISYKGGVMDYSDVFRRLKFREAPFQNDIVLSFNVYDFDGINAIEVLLNGEVCGEVPGYMVDELLPQISKKVVLEEISIYGGVDRRYGCSLTVHFS